MYTFIGIHLLVQLEKRNLNIDVFLLVNFALRERQREEENIFFEIFNSILSGYFHIFDIINIV